ncbi:uncharacterized protein LOC114321863 isoform X4 [Camellia sinensis]|uniref:uncharacterized protein LOC114321863 isoform X4 n=1 Tax=Camellia sinensis TaxID=4442 RepID=UPI001036559F|nr:uncharacterized protein LOC114321863 isoform X4 [Camellia sinensis]
MMLLVGNEREHLHACLTKQGGMILPNTQMWNLSQITRYSHLIQLTIPEIRNYFIKALTRPNPDNRGCRQLLLNSRF